MSNGVDPLLGFEQMLRELTAVQIANLVTSYVLESNHNSWDGHSKRDLTAYRNLFRDMMLCRNDMAREGGPAFTGGHHVYKAA
jgi:hypothetical protein